jgi:hypothetical protein
MFSQQTIKKMNMGMQFQNNQYGYPQPPYNDYSQFHGASDNFSCYSSSTTATGLSGIKKRNITEDFNLILTSCIEELLPKIAEGCAELVYSKISTELDNQAKQIEELKEQIENFINNNHRQFTSTPIKKLKNIQSTIKKVNGMVHNQLEILKDQNEQFENNTNNYAIPFIENIEDKLKSLQSVIEDERKMTEKINYDLKDRYVDFLGIKNFVDEKIGYMLTDIKLKSSPNQNNQYYQIINSINKLSDEITNGMVGVHKKPYSNLDIHHQELINGGIIKVENNRIHDNSSHIQEIQYDYNNVNSNLNSNMICSNLQLTSCPNMKMDNRKKTNNKFKKFSF